MGFIFDFLGGISGYILWFFFDAVSNYALAITLFSIFINILILPLTIKRQKDMALNARVNLKQVELKKKYKNDVKKYNEELSKLYEKEGISPVSGCFSMIFPLLLLGGVYGAVTKPLQNTLHIAADKVAKAVSVLPNIPEISGRFFKGYEQFQLVRYFEDIKQHLTMFNAEEFADVEEYSRGFNFFGINLLSRPRGSEFSEMLWIIPVLCFIISILGMYLNQKLLGTQSQTSGCMKFAPYAGVLVTTYFAYTAPGAVGFYWFISGVIGAIQSFILNKYYNLHTINAKNEAARLALLEIKEESVKCVKDVGTVRKNLSKQKALSSKK